MPGRKARQFFKIGYSSSALVATGMQLVNEKKLLQPGQNVFIQSIFNPGFPDLPETPKLRCTSAAIRGLHDKIDHSGYWLISERMKAVLTEIDPDAFAFAPCEIVDLRGAPGPVRWLCDVIRVVDALDEAASDARLTYYGERKAYNLMGTRRLVFDAALVGSAHVFRMEHMRPQIICDDIFRDACKSAGLKVLRFGNAIDPHARTPQKWVEHCRRLAKEASPSAHTTKKAAVFQGLLATALVELGTRESDTAALTEAVSIYRQMLETEPGRLPLRLERTIADLRKVVLLLGKRAEGSAELEDARRALLEAEKRQGA